MIAICSQASPAHSEQDGCQAFDLDWQQALITRDLRWFSYPAEQPVTQTELFEFVKAGQIERLLSAQNIRAGRVVEFGCGSAGMSIFLANMGFEVYASDISTNALCVARVNASLHESPDGLYFICGDTFCLPFGDGAFDVVMSYGLLEHFDERQLPKLLNEVLRVLRPGGLFLADIVPGPQRFSSRTVGLILSYVGSVLYHLVTGQGKKVGQLYETYFQHFYENVLDDREWARLLEQAGLQAVVVEVCRPFPPLAVRGRLERAYIKLMQAAMPLWKRFDGKNSWLSRRWGWMYLAHGMRPRTGYSWDGACAIDR